MQNNDKLRFIFRHPIWVYVFVYALAHFWILLLGNARYWDDWIFSRTPASDILSQFDQTGSMFNMVGYLHVLLQPIGGWSYKVGTFFAYLFSGILLDKIVKRTNLVGPFLRINIVLLYLVLPLNFARVAQIDFPYALCYLLFFGAWWLIESKKWVSLLLFFLSFNTNSLLVFYALPAIDTLNRMRNKKELWKISCWINLLPFAVLPFLYFAIKILFFKPYGLYQGYNEHYSARNVAASLYNQIINFFSYYWLFLTILFVFLFVVFLYLFFSKKIKRSFITGSGKLITIGLVALFFGCFPYWIIGKAPNPVDWDSRYQLLMPLGLALVGIGIFSIAGKKVCAAFSFIIIIASTYSWMKTYRDFYYDAVKQNKLVALFKANNMIRNSDLIVVSDETRCLNTWKRSYRFYEWNGLIATAFDDETRFTLTENMIPSYKKGDYDRYFLATYNASSHHRSANPKMAYADLKFKMTDAIDNVCAPENIKDIILITRNNMALSGK